MVKLRLGFAVFVYGLLILGSRGLASEQCVPVQLDIPNEYQRFYRTAGSLLKGLDRCILFAQSSSFVGSRISDSRFVSCATHSAPPERGAGKPCSRPDYIRSISALLEVTSHCMGIADLRPFLPKFTGESGIFHNAFGPGRDAGLGQMTSIAIRETTKFLSVVREKWKNHPHPICRELSRQKQLWLPLALSEVNSPRTVNLSACETIAAPWGPARNVLHTFILATTEIGRISAQIQKYGIVEKLGKLGMTAADSEDKRKAWELPKEIYRLEDLNGILVAVAYNAGASEIGNRLSGYLDKRIALNAALTKDHFNFKTDMSKLNSMNENALKNLKTSEVTFPEYLKIHQLIGHPGYGSDMMRWIYRFNENVGQDVCTPARIEGFLAL